MGLLMWEKPKRAQSKEAHAQYGFEDGPTGGYVPNMSQEDADAWKAKITGQKLGYPQVEIRKQAGGALMTIIVNLGDGYNYKNYRSVLKDDPNDWRSRNLQHNPFRNLYSADYMTFGLGMHIALNGGGQLSVEEMQELPLIIEEAKAVLNQQVKVPGDRKHYALWLDPNTDGAPIRDGIEEMGGKVSVYRPEFNFIYFTAPFLLVEPAFQLSRSIRAIYTADRIIGLARECDDYRGSPQENAARLDERMRTAGPNGAGHPIIKRLK